MNNKKLDGFEKVDATIELLANYSKQRFIEEIVNPDTKQIITIEVKAPTGGELREIKRMAGDSGINWTILLVAICLTKPKLSQAEVENLNHGIISAIGAAIEKHANFKLKDDFLKDSLGATEEESTPEL